MRIIGYTYEADLHCVDCTRARYRDSMAAVAMYYGKDFVRKTTDEHGIPLNAHDNDRNPIVPIFSTSEPDEAGEYCGDCHKDLRS